MATDGLHLTQSLHIVARDSHGRSAECVLLLVDRDPGPLILLDGPVESPPPGFRLHVSGRVADPSGGTVDGWLESLVWSVLPAGRGGRVAVDEAGAFTADIDLAGLEGRAVAWLRAEDRFGHLTLMAVRSGAPPAAAEIEITSPAGIGWYRSSLSVEGRVVGSSTPVESLAWSVSGDEGLSGEILVDSDGAFTLELETADLAGDRLLSLAGGDADSSVSAVEIELRDGRLEPGCGSIRRRTAARTGRGCGSRVP